MVTSPRRTARSSVPPPTNRGPRRIGRRGLIVSGVGLAIVAVATVVLVAQGRGHSPAPGQITPAARSRSYSSVSDCLLTGPGGIQTSPAAPVWAGMEDSSKTTHAQVSYLAMQGPDTMANAEVYINTLALRGCAVILAAGPAPAQAAGERATAWPHQVLVAVSGQTTPPTTAKTPSGNLTVLPGTDVKTLTAQVENLLGDRGTGSTTTTG